MKSIYKLFLRPQRWLLATVAAAVAGCDKPVQTPPPAVGEIPVSLQATLVSETGETWQADDAAGLFMLQAGGTLPTVLNAAAEEAVRAFLAERISFFGIAETISETLSRIPREEASCFAQLQEADMRARRTARKLLYDV